jgi:tetratricopeptide (TPR) repeat protein
MRFISLSLVVVLFGKLLQPSFAAEPAAGSEKASSQRLGELDQQFSKTVTEFGDQAALSAALKKRRADWSELLKSIEAKDPAKMIADDHATAAILYQRLGLPEESLPHAEAAVKKDGENELYRLLLIYMLLDNKQLDAAEAAYAELVAKAPDSRNVKQLRLKLSGAQVSAGSASKGAVATTSKARISCVSVNSSPHSNARIVEMKFPHVSIMSWPRSASGQLPSRTRRYRRFSRSCWLGRFSITPSRARRMKPNRFSRRN